MLQPHVDFSLDSTSICLSQISNKFTPTASSVSTKLDIFWLTSSLLELSGSYFSFSPPKLIPDVTLSSVNLITIEAEGVLYEPSNPQLWAHTIWVNACLIWCVSVAETEVAVTRGLGARSLRPSAHRLHWPPYCCFPSALHYSCLWAQARGM